MNRKDKLRIIAFFKYTALILMSFIFLFPLYWMLRTSVMDLGDIFQIPIIYFPREIQLQHYNAAFKVFPLGRYMLNSLLVTSLATIGAVFSSSLCAFGFSHIKWKMREKVFTIVLSSMLLPTAVTLIPTFLEWHAIGVMDSYIPLIVPYWFGGGAMNIFLLRQFFRTIPKALDESAVIDGAGYFTIYSRIIVPLSKPVLVVVVMFAFTTSWNDFLNPIIYLNTQSKYTMSIGLQLFMTAFQTSWNQLMAAAAVAIVPCILIFLYSQKYIVEGITFTGMKG
jgi:multiple sugar transport system permease protein